MLSPVFFARRPAILFDLKARMREESSKMIGYKEALEQTLQAVRPLDAEVVPLMQLVGRVAAEGIYATVDSPSVDASFKDGYAVRSADVAGARPESPVRLRLIGTVPAGGTFDGVVTPGTAVRILSGARIPEGAEAVLADEFASDDGQFVVAVNDAEPGRNILRRGCDVRNGDLLVAAGTVLRPAQVGLLAAAGLREARVVRRPRVAIIATGDEVVAPGGSLREGQLFASNLVTLASWCAYFGMATTLDVVSDDPDAIRARVLEAIRAGDAVLTSGGAWNGERDFVVALLHQLGWREIYHRVRMGPGKAVGFGLLEGKPVFCLPGGPPSNQMAFVQLALPGLLRLGGRWDTGLPQMSVTLAESVAGQEDWTQFIEGRLEYADGEALFHPFRMGSRLRPMARSDGILQVPEGVSAIPAGSRVRIQVLPCA